ncbi:putative Golgi apparatus and endoplasmic reticulum protein Svp26 [Xylona heveae TC161]|uniref:Putative Golgi apparatus and endoplasmic reticulum protein Svp26 n=1 Tax=Xylona heveae (strain CBS 132557 / TC161) TaxID=1328760 RepID=A0A165IBG2_XYLHT|nr:putative Golgi apparatus and endoplasmic reticulum protein Svp26 [Xylona heveae TC161]KZF24664.1 putative Golgi apparatus and endoplasmic reticulum protein Svp26 [Xylona heveae TC161]
MWILPLVGYAGIVLGFCFLTLAIASGLYYLSELVEEHTVLAKKLLTRLIYTIIGIQVFLWLVDRFPFFLSLLSIVSHVVYAGNLRRFPYVKLSDPLFLLSCLLVIFNHFAWFRHFSQPPTLPPAGRPSALEPLDVPSFSEIASYFGLCVWLVPFALFVSLSAGENVLPSMGSEYATGDTSASAAASAAGTGPASALGDPTGARSAGGERSKSKGLAKAAVDGVREWVGETGELMGFWRGEKSRRF